MADQRDAIEEVRHRLNILDVISEYVAIKRAGKNYLGLCPFHGEKTPSFTVREEFQTFHCFGCGEHGDAFSFLMKIENLTFQEALERLAKRTGVEIERFQSPQTSRREVLRGINSQAAAYFSALLKRTPVAQQYLGRRGLADSTIEQFQLGYAAPAWDGLASFLAKKNISEKDSEEAGLLIRGERGCYDRFRHRVIFPIVDIQDRVIGFGGRAFGDDNPKYLNSPETPLFSKTKAVYGLNLARKAISDSGFVIVVEGYMDVIAAHQSGFVNCVATLGTALTPDHITILSRYTQKIVLAYDADSAGMKAALRGASMFDEAECDVRIARLPGGDDPDSMLMKGRTSEFASALKDALPLLDYRLEILRARFDLSQPAARAAFMKEAAKLLAEIPGSADRERYIKQLIDFHPNWSVGPTAAQDQIRTDINRLVKQRHGEVIKKTAVGSATRMNAVQKAENAVLRLMIHGDFGSESLFNLLTPEDFSDELRCRAATAVFDMYGRKKSINLPELLSSVDAETSRFISELAMKEESEPVNSTVLQDYVDLIKNTRLRRSRASEFFAPYLNGGVIDPANAQSEDAREKLQEYLRKTGKLKKADEQ